MSHPHDPDRVFDSAMGEVTTQAEDGTVIRVEAQVPSLESLCARAEACGYRRAIIDALDTVWEHLPVSEERLRLAVALAAMAGVKVQ